jgi:hypothetical protein
MIRLTRPALALALALVAGNAAAQTEPSPTHLAAAREVIQLTGAMISIDEILPALTEDLKKQAVTRPEMVKDLDEVIKLLQPELGLQRQQALNVAARTYAKWLSEAEMRDVIAFYKTPSGAKWSQIQPALVEDVVTALTGWSQEAAEYVMVRTRAEMAKRGHQMQ